MWNRTNPWGTPSLPETMTFRYPLTCCPLGNVQPNWNDLPLDKLQDATYCAISGTDIYETVRSFIIDQNEIENI
jgi:hypothetical protein